MASSPVTDADNMPTAAGKMELGIEGGDAVEMVQGDERLGGDVFQGFGQTVNGKVAWSDKRVGASLLTRR